MVALAALNRLRLTPQILAASGNFSGAHEPAALLWLRRAAVTEFLIGLAIVIVIGALGATIPARHGQPVWPLPFAFDWDLIDESTSVRNFTLFAGAGAVLGVLLATWGVSIRRWSLSLVGVVAALASVAVVAERLLVPAYATTYFRSPVSYTVTSVAQGASLFAHDCEPCHGPRGHGDGPAAKYLGIKPANLTEHAFHHREGDLFWWVKQGIAGTPMPSFEGRLSDGEIWDVINFLRVLTQSEASQTLNAYVDPWRPIIAPDLTFQIGRQAQESLKQQRGRAIVLLIFYSPQESLRRLQWLTASKPTLDRAGVRVVAMPINPSALYMENGVLPAVDDSILARFEPESVATYLLFAQTALAEDAARSMHVEFLIDRQGYLRARWQPGLPNGWEPISELGRQIEILNREEPHAPASEAHLH
jgi:putative copper resistance protein D